MLSHIYSCGLSGIDGFSVCVETDISNGLPAFDIVGLPDAAVKEAKERIRSAIKNTGFRFPAKHIVINLPPPPSVKRVRDTIYLWHFLLYAPRSRFMHRT